MSMNSDSNSEDEDDYIDDADLGDWRSFRKTLVDSGLSSETSDEGYIGEQTPSSDSGSSDIDASKGSTVDRPKSVSKKNEELLKSQSEELAKEYRDGVWAHEASFVSEQVDSCLGIFLYFIYQYNASFTMRSIRPRLGD